MSLPHSITWSAVIVVKIDQHDQAVSDIRKLRTTDSTIQATNVSRLAHWNKKSLITRMMSWKGQLLLNGVVFCVSIYLKNSGFYGGKSRTRQRSRHASDSFAVCFVFHIKVRRLKTCDLWRLLFPFWMDRSYTFWIGFLENIRLSTTAGLSDCETLCVYPEKGHIGWLFQDHFQKGSIYMCYI